MENCNQHKELPKFYCGTCLDIAESKAIKKIAKQIFEEIEKVDAYNGKSIVHCCFEKKDYDRIKAKFLQDVTKE